MNTFYKQKIFLQWLEAILLSIIGFYPMIKIIELTNTHLVFSIFFIVYLPVAQFSSTALFKLIGIYKYYSPMLLGYMPNDAQIDLHSGSSFDYLFVMSKFKNGIDIRNRILLYHLEGLLNIVDQIEKGQIPNTVEISGTSYFFNEKSIHRLGFKYKTPSLFYKLNLLVNFIDLTWMYSLSKGKISIPKVWNAKKASIVGSKLVEQKDKLKELYDRIAIRNMKLNTSQ